jgi:hypothetical protein
MARNGVVKLNSSLYQMRQQVNWQITVPLLSVNLLTVYPLYILSGKVNWYQVVAIAAVTDEGLRAWQAIDKAHVLSNAFLLQVIVLPSSGVRLGRRVHPFHNEGARSQAGRLIQNQLQFKTSAEPLGNLNITNAINCDNKLGANACEQGDN